MPPECGRASARRSGSLRPFSDPGFPEPVQHVGVGFGLSGRDRIGAGSDPIVLLLLQEEEARGQRGGSDEADGDGANRCLRMGGMLPSRIPFYTSPGASVQAGDAWA